MNIDISIRTYNSYGGDATLSLLGDFITQDAPDFGTAIEELEIDLYFGSRGGPKRTLENLFQQFHSSLRLLPRSRFLRKKRRFKLEYQSKVTVAEELRKYGTISVELFAAGFEELRQHLQMMRTKLKSSDDFNADAFFFWVAHMQKRLPQDAEALARLADESRARRQARYAAMDEWDNLGLDWEDFHRDARRVLDDPFFWSSTDDFAPNGNDTGSDVLCLFSEWRKRHRNESSEIFFNGLMVKWDIDTNTDGSDEFSVQTFDDASIGLAFAHLKLDGVCPDWVRDVALKSIARQVHLLQAKYPDWEHLARRLQTFEAMANKLRTLPNKDFPADAQKDACG